MYHLRLIKALSYTSVVKATKQHPDVFVEDKATADAAVATGYFQFLGAGPEPEVEKDDGETQPDDGKANEQEPDDREANGETQPDGEKEQSPGKKLEKMTVPELETFAAYKGISLKGASKKADIIAKLKAELDASETENEVAYGSPTMQELMEQ